MDVYAGMPEGLRQQLAEHFERTRAYFAEWIGGEVRAVVLGGGYGRGEGGIYWEADGRCRLYNDLDYFIVCKRRAGARLKAAVAEWERRERARLGIDVEGVCLGPWQIDCSGGSMLFHDLFAGHHVVAGPADTLQRMGATVDAGRIGVGEASRLLWNRGTGLLYARVDLAAEVDAAGLAIVHRNQRKAALGIGDALLAAAGGYASTVAERARRVAAMPGITARIKALHAEGAAFKTAPDAAPGRAELAARQAELETLWLAEYLKVEGARLGGCAFVGARAYAQWRGRLEPTQGLVKNILLGLRDRVRRGGSLWPVWDYPRGALRRALVLGLTEDWPLAWRYLGGGGGGDRMALRHKYEQWWRHYS